MNFFSSFPFSLKGSTSTDTKASTATTNAHEANNASNTKKTNNRRRNKTKKFNFTRPDEQDENSKEAKHEEPSPNSSTPQEEDKPQQSAENTNDGSTKDNFNKNNYQEEEEAQNTTDTPPKTSQKNKKKKKPKKPENNLANENSTTQENTLEDLSSKKQSYEILVFNDKMIRLSHMDPNFNEVKPYMESILSLYNDMKEICNSSNEQLVEHQRSWYSMMQKCNDLMKKQPNFNAFKPTFFNGNSETYKMATDIFNMNENKGQDSNDESSYYDDSKISSNETTLNENMLMVKSSNGNKRALRKFLNNVKDELAKLDKTFQKNLEKARDEVTKDNFNKKYITLRQKLGMPEVDKGKIFTTNYAVPPQFNSMKIKMNEAFAKLARFFTVDVTVQSNKTFTFVITGLKNDVESCINYLNEMDFEGDDTLQLDSSQMGSIIGRGGQTIRQLENDHKTMVHISDQNLTLYSSPAFMDKFKAHIQSIIQKQRVPMFYEGLDIAANIYQAMVKHLSPEVKKLSDETNTIIKMIDKGDEGRISVKGKDKNVIASVLQKLRDLENQISVYQVSQNSAAIEKFSSMPEYASYMKNKNFTIQKEGGNLMMIGLSDSIKKEKEKLNNIFAKLSTTPSTITLQNMQWNFCKKSSKYNTPKDVITLASPGTNDSCTIEFYGEDSHKQKAKESLENFVNNDAFIQKLELSEAKFETFGDYRKQVKQFEGSYGINIEFPSSQKMWITLMGNPDKVEDAKKSIDKLLNQGSMLLTTIDIKRYQVPMLKGPEGATIKEIQSKSKIKYINIDDKNMVVRLKGTQDSINTAKGMIENAISKGFEIKSFSENNGTHKYEADEMIFNEEAKEEKSTSKNEEVKTDKEVKSGKSEQNSESAVYFKTKNQYNKINFLDNYEDTFPSLNDSIKRP